MISAIVSITQNRAIGSRGALVVRNKADMLRFKELTTGGTVVMGRKTFESFPKGALPNRRNVVITSDPLWSAEHVEVAPSPHAALELVSGDEAVWVIGGESIYRALLDACERVEITLNHTNVEEADAFFPALSLDEWRLASSEKGGVTQAGIEFEYQTYERI